MTCQSANHLNTQLECQTDKPVSHPVKLPATSAHQRSSQSGNISMHPAFRRSVWFNTQQPSGQMQVGGGEGVLTE